MAIRIIGHCVMYLPERKKDERKPKQTIQEQENKKGYELTIKSLTDEIERRKMTNNRNNKRITK